MKNSIRKLRANEIECRVGTISEKGFSILLYKNARVDMQILDETFGAENWQRDHKELKGVIYCGIGIYFGNDWVWKWDCGAESFSDKEKGESSDSFKRAGFNWGIGRELYTAPFIWINGNVKKLDNGKLVPTIKDMYVEEIEYDENGISKLVIIGNGDTIFSYNDNRKENKPAEKQEREQGIKQETSKQEITIEDAKMRKTTKGKYYYELDDKQLQWIVDSEKSSAESKQCAEMVLQDRQSLLNDCIEIEDGDLPF